MSKRIVHTETNLGGELLGRVYFDYSLGEYRAVIARHIGISSNGYFTDSLEDAIATLRADIVIEKQSVEMMGGSI